MWWVLIQVCYIDLKIRVFLIIFLDRFNPCHFRGGVSLLFFSSTDKLLNLKANYITEHMNSIKVYILLHISIDISPHMYVSLYIIPPCFFIHLYTSTRKNLKSPCYLLTSHTNKSHQLSIFHIIFLYK